MLIIIGFVIVACLVVYKRSTEIIVVNPMRYHQPSAKASESIDFGRILNTIQDAAAEAAKEANAQGSAQIRHQGDKGRDAIRNMVRNHQFIEAIKRYSEVYGVDLRTAKRAVDVMMREE